MSKAVVTEIQVCGGRVVTTLYDACLEYIGRVSDGVSRKKLNFDILLPDGSRKHITIRQEDGELVAYGNFEGLPSMLDYAQMLRGEGKI